MVFRREDLRVDVVKASSVISPVDSECIGSTATDSAVSVFFLEVLFLEAINTSS